MRYFCWVVIALLFLIRYETVRPKYKDGDKVRILAKITSEPIRSTSYQKTSLAGVTIFLPVFPEIYYGDKVLVEGRVKDGKITQPEKFEIIKEADFLSIVRKKLLDFYKKSFPEPHSSLVAGVVVGSKDTTSAFFESLKATGTMHVVVASGMNVTLVAGFLINSLVMFINRKKAIPAALVGIWIYSLVSGFNAPIIRAAIMGSIALFAQEAGRIYHSLRTLFLTGLVMLFINPLWIADLGFILSFLATTSLILFTKAFERRLYFIPALIREGFVTSLAAQIGVTPLMFLTFGQLNIVSPLINALVLWVVPLITIIGMFSGILALAFPVMGKLLLYLSYPLTTWFITIIDLFSF